MTSTTPEAVPGWYPDAVPGRLRWFDGAAWTDHVTLAPAAASQAAQPQAPVQPQAAFQPQAPVQPQAAFQPQAPVQQIVRPYSGHTSSSPFATTPRDPIHWMLPTGRSGWAIVAGYAALLAVFIWPLGPLALFAGVMGLRVISRDRTHGRGRAWFGIVVGALATVGFLWLLLLWTAG